MNNLHILEILPILLYLAAILAIGIRKRDGDNNAENFMLGGRQLTFPAFIATLVTTWYGGILGVGEFTWLYGVSNWIVFGLPYYIFALIFAFVFAPKIQSAPMLSIPDQFFHHFGKTGGVLSAIFTFFMVLPAPYVLMVGFLLMWITGWSLWICIILGTLFSMIYVLNGGFHAVVRTDKLQFLLMFGGFILLFGFLVGENGGIGFLQSNLPELHLTWHGGNSVQTMLVWFFIAAWTFVDPGFHQRCAAAKSPKIARNGILASVGFWLMFDFLTTSCGLYARALLDGSGVSPALSFPVLGHEVLPPLLSGLFLTGLLATIMSTVDSFSLLSAITIGHDLIGKWRKPNGVSLLRTGLAISAIISIGLAIAVPSVINIWLLIGNIFIPPMLLPLVACYFPAANPGKFWVNINLIGAFAVSFGWLLFSAMGSDSLANLAFAYDIPPMYPGMLFSVIVFGLGIFRKDN